VFIRSKSVRGETYYQVIHGYRDEQSRVRHRVIASLGREPTLEGAMAVEKRKLTQLRRRRSRIAAISPGARLREKVLALDSRIGSAVVKMSLLASLVDKTFVVGTTPVGTKNVVPTSDEWDVQAALAFGRQWNAEDPTMAIGHGMMIHFLIEHAPETAAAMKPGDDLVEAFRKARGRASTRLTHRFSRTP
jgi:hypothetical protein